ncbi:hypothetical protein NPIL_73071 [Nephila pilipes]|uniref:Uncharacterized protein n=1 Tax=Nephila pilipes TaxID=299642 RepID=A0A8X6NX13_NEPPI|nr:hypothetical protein NPIL_73071 [Nephila pilipes]
MCCPATTFEFKITFCPSNTGSSRLFSHRDADTGIGYDIFVPHQTNCNGEKGFSHCGMIPPVSPTFYVEKPSFYYFRARGSYSIHQNYH